MSLVADKVGELTAESSVDRLFFEWLGKWFDGAAHTLGDNAPAVFPKASIEMGQSATAQPLNGLEIRMVQDAAGGEITASENGRQIIEPLTLLFWVKANVTAGQNMSSKGVALQAAELLAAILRNPAATRELSQKGLHDIRPRRPRVIADEKYAMQLVACRCRVIYEVKF